jgi:hypothetical protein
VAFTYSRPNFTMLYCASCLYKSRYFALEQMRFDAYVVVTFKVYVKFAEDTEDGAKINVRRLVS